MQVNAVRQRGGSEIADASNANHIHRAGAGHSYAEIFDQYDINSADLHHRAYPAVGFFRAAGWHPANRWPLHFFIGGLSSPAPATCQTARTKRQAMTGDIPELRDLASASGLPTAIY